MLDGAFAPKMDEGTISRATNAPVPATNRTLDKISSGNDFVATIL
jgi:hypothetical protein